MGGHAPIDPALVVDRVARLRDEAESAAGRGIAIVAVTKSLGVDAIAAARLAGCDAIGENYAAEIIAKTAGSPQGIPVHFIGRLQTNKVRGIAGLVDLWQSIDRDRAIDAVARECAPSTPILVQVNATGEPDKGGAPPADVPRLVERARAAGIVVEGLMTVGPTSGDVALTEAAFRACRRLCDEEGLATCSMGMSGDWRTAVDLGSTMIRVGTLLFGPRR